MKSIIKSIILSTFLSFNLTSCGSIKDAIDDVNPLGGGDMAAKIDGKDWKATSVTVAGTSTGGQLLSIGGVSLTAKNSIGVNFDLKKGKIEAGKSYTLGSGTFAELTHDTDPDNYYSTDEVNAGTSGTIKVDTYDGKTISGSFSGVLYDSKSKKKVTITAGTFNGKIGLL
jgi:hypothetical protein